MVLYIDFDMIWIQGILAEEVMEMEQSEGSSSKSRVLLEGSVEWLLELLLKKYCPQTHPSCRQVSLQGK